MLNYGLRPNKKKYLILTQDEYDDRMIASIELKSTDFNDENFSPVFNRVTKEFFLKPGQKFSDGILIMKKIIREFWLQFQVQLVLNWLIDMDN